MGKCGYMAKKRSTGKAIARSAVNQPVSTPMSAASRDKAPAAASGSAQVAGDPKKPDASLARPPVKHEPALKTEVNTRPRPAGDGPVTKTASTAIPSSQLTANKSSTPTSSQNKQEAQPATAPPNKTQAPADSSKHKDPKAESSSQQSAPTVRPNPTIKGVNPIESKTVESVVTDTKVSQTKQTSTSTSSSTLKPTVN